MKSEEIRSLFAQFEAAAVLQGVECWSSRELQSMLGYSKWENFEKVIQKAKDLAAEMTGLNVQSKDLKGQTKIEREHIDNNLAVRNMLTQRGIVPENLPPAEDVKKLQRKLVNDEKNLLKRTKKKK